MLIKNSQDEVKKRESSFKIIKSILNEKGRRDLYDLTGLSGGFIASENDLNLLETYVGPAIFEEELETLGKEHLGGEKVLAVNRTSSGILATILSLVCENSYIIHYLPEFPAHPSITRSAKLIGANYIEFDNLDDFHIPENTSLIIITGSTMDHKVIDEDIFKEVINRAKMRKIPVFVDDASGARLRTILFNQKKAIDLGADLVVTSTDKLMFGPRGGLMAGKKELINKIKSKAHQFGLEAQPPSILAMVNGLKSFNGENIKNSIEKKQELINLLNNKSSGTLGNVFEETPTGVMISEESLKNELKSHRLLDNISSKDCCFLLAMNLLKNEGIITIPAVSMPGASPTIRFDLSSHDCEKLKMETLADKIFNSFNSFLEIVNDYDKSEELLFS
ncbi:TIGR03576 family pyridoxal phosphate-dependent enzyme [Methanobrevibacter filiformis]|nr:TIGR03576 family pyridoxal phosphate-dependent enzyme [Methanobrevibacter filiformis]